MPFHRPPFCRVPPLVVTGNPDAFLHSLMVSLRSQTSISVPPQAAWMRPSTGAVRFSARAMSVSSWAVNQQAAENSSTVDEFGTTHE